LFVNMLFLIVTKKIPKIVIGLEVFFTLYFIIQFIYGFQTPSIKDGILQKKPNPYQIIFFATYVFFIISALVYTGFCLIRNKNFNNNIYELKIKRWVLSYIVCLMVLALTYFLLLLSTSKKIFIFYDDSVITSFAQRFLFILFVLFRPKFLDDDRYSMPFNELLIKAKGIAFKDFEFIFYTNHYYLLPDANLEDLALKLNTSKIELTNFLRDGIEENFTELLNKNRIEYLKELLIAKKYESFTIEALSEMAGFNNRRNMYYAFNRHVGLTPTDFIKNIK